MVSGHWWAARRFAQASPVVDHVADRLHLHVGSEVNFESDDQLIKTTVAAIYKSDGEHVYGRSEFILPKKALKGCR